MKVEFTHIFIKIYKKRFPNKPNFHTKFDDRVRIFTLNSNDPTLSDHALTGELKDHRSFSITGDVRVVYYIHNGIAYFVDVGTHNQVYGKRKKN